MPGYETIGEEELDEIKDIFANGGVLFRHGFESKRGSCYKVLEFEKEFGKRIGSEHCLAVTSGTAALRVALAALGIGAGDEVITPCFTFVATVEAVIEAGATPVCAEIDETLNLDPELVVPLITDKTKAIIAVHMLGTPARLKELRDICDKNGLCLIEDTAWGCGGYLDTKALGTWGDIGTFSFDFAKTITTGEGGMLCFRDKSHWLKACAWHDHGHENNPKVPRWEDTRSSSGFNYRMTELQGAVGLAQLRKLQTIVDEQRRKSSEIWNTLKELKGITLREEPDGSRGTADALIFMVESQEHAARCRNELLNIGISTKILPEAVSWHYSECWDHMPEIRHGCTQKKDTAYRQSRDILSRAVSIPINLGNLGAPVTEIKNAIAKALTTA